MKNRYVLVTTNKDCRGVFGGIFVSHEKDIVILKEARMAVKWSTDMHGVFGLAKVGPSDSCRISPSVPKIQLNKVTAVIDMEKGAWKKWEKEPWG